MRAVLDYTNVVFPLADAVMIEPEPSRDVLDALVPAVRDELNQGIVSEFADRNHLAMLFWTITSSKQFVRTCGSANSGSCVRVSVFWRAGARQKRTMLGSIEV
jgi:hypothetical protein